MVGSSNSSSSSSSSSSSRSRRSSSSGRRSSSSISSIHSPIPQSLNLFFPNVHFDRPTSSGIHLLALRCFKPWMGPTFPEMGMNNYSQENLKEQD